MKKGTCETCGEDCDELRNEIEELREKNTELENRLFDIKQLADI